MQRLVERLVDSRGIDLLSTLTKLLRHRKGHMHRLAENVRLEFIYYIYMHASSSKHGFVANTIFDDSSPIGTQLLVSQHPP